MPRTPVNKYVQYVIDLDGNPVPGIFHAPSGITVRFDRNYLVVDDRDAWQPGGPLEFPAVLRIHHGYLVYRDIRINAVPAPYHGVAAVVLSGSRLEDTLTGFVGVAARGYKGTEWHGLTSSVLRRLKRHVRSDELRYELPPAVTAHDYTAVVRSARVDGDELDTLDTLDDSEPLRESERGK